MRMPPQVPPTARARTWVALMLGLCGVASLMRFTCAAAPPATAPGTANQLERPAAGAYSVVVVPANHARVPELAVATPRLAWGAGPGELGRREPGAGNPEGPMAFAVTEGAGLAILDQRKQRVVFTDKTGAWLREVAVTLRAPQDLMRMPSGEWLLADRLADGRVEVWDSAFARRTAQLDLRVPTFGEPSGATAILASNGVVYAEREHGVLVALGDLQGRAPAANAEPREGRPTRDGLHWVRAGITQYAPGRVWLASTAAATMRHEYTREYRLERSIAGIVALDSDPAGTLVLGLLDQSFAYISVLCIESATGVLQGTAQLRGGDRSLEMFREMVVEADGTIVHAEADADGVTFRRYRCAP